MPGVNIRYMRGPTNVNKAPIGTVDNIKPRVLSVGLAINFSATRVINKAKLNH